jgi:ubiquinone biosynthesis monooxygenase Coq7
MFVRATTRTSPRALALARYVSISSRSGPQPSAAYLDPSKARDPSTTQTPEDLTEAQRGELHRALRVDQAGEVAANYIYKGQLAVFQTDSKYGPLIQVSSAHSEPIC